MPGFANDASNNSIMWSDNIDFSGNVIPSRAITTDGQLLIGSTASPNIRVGTLTAGTGISITNGSGSISIAVDGSVVGETITGNVGGPLSPVTGNWNIFGSTIGSGTNPVSTNGSGNTLTLNVQRSQAIAAADSTKIGLSNFNSSNFSVDSNGFVSIIGGGFAWSDTSGTVTAVAENGYFITTTCTSTLPASPAEGDTVKYIVDTTNLLTITAAGSQKIRIGTTLSAAGGTAVNTQRGDAVTLVYRTSGTTWFAEANPVGGWNVT